MVAFVLGACGLIEPAANPRTPYPLPSDATALTLETAPPVASVPDNWACPMNTIGSPAQMVRDGDAVVFEEVASGRRLGLVWPRGFSARLRNGTAELVAPGGAVIVREGEAFLDIIGGPPNICWVKGVFYGPAS